MTFQWWDKTLTYRTDTYNDTGRNERAVEVPVALSWLSEQTGAGLEVGNVLGHYTDTQWPIVDRYETGEGVTNADVFDIAGKFDWIVSVSTVEHVRWDEEPKDPNAAAEAIAHLRTVLNPGGSMLITIPLGYHPPLDAQLLAGLPGCERACTLVRDCGEWTQTPEPGFRPYGLTQPWAEAVWIGELCA